MPKGEGPRTTTVTYPFVGGLDQKTASQYLDPAANQASIVNGVISKVGSVDHRLGIKYLTNNVIGPTGPTYPGNITSATRGASWSRSSRVVMGPEGLYSYEQPSFGFVAVGNIPAIKATQSPMASGAPGTNLFAFPLVQDVPYSGRTIRVAMYLAAIPGSTAGLNSNLYATAFDADSGDLLIAPQLLATGAISPIQIMYLQGAPVENNVILIYANYSQSITGANIFALYYDQLANKFTVATGIQTVSNYLAIPGSVDAVPWYVPGQFST